MIVRLGDALLYLTDPTAAAQIRQHWDAALYLADRRLPDRVSQTWLAPTPGQYPIGLTLQLTRTAPLHTRWIDAHPSLHTPAHLRVRIDRLIWQVCDHQAWTRIGDALFAAQQHLNTT